MEFNPRTFARIVSCPALILHGDRDSNVPVEHANLLADAIRAGGNSDVIVEILTGYNHLFLEDADGFFRRYGELLTHTNQVSGKVLILIADWLTEHLSGVD